MKNLKLSVKNIYCSWCAKLIKNDLAKELGIKKAFIKEKDDDIQEIYLRVDKNIKMDYLIKILQRRGVELISID